MAKDQTFYFEPSPKPRFKKTNGRIFNFFLRHIDRKLHNLCFCQYNLEKPEVEDEDEDEGSNSFGWKSVDIEDDPLAGKLEDDSNLDDDIDDIISEAQKRAEQAKSLAQENCVLQ